MNMDRFDQDLNQILAKGREVNLGFWEKQAMGFSIMGKIFGSLTAGLLLVPKKAVALAGLSLLAIGGGSVWAAEQALPGDALYGLKVAAHNGVGVVVQVAPEAKANWAIKEIDRTMREIEKFEEEGGQVDVELEAQTNTIIETQLDNFYEAKAKVVAKKGAKAGEKLETRLGSRVRNLARWLDGEAMVGGGAEGKIEAETEAEVKGEAVEGDAEGKTEIETQAEAEGEAEKDEAEAAEARGKSGVRFELPKIKLDFSF
ncbi:MAG: Outer membrane protein, OmpA/MotB family [Candidatus Beckwithbacteria bacterium GW2011_GWB1_47_15]|uniref:Outer membrane protein, OmpA/MotB family n=1 Tax=Candidatus Beckwithbacteria bacterium GW2011_GWB1_47_15 TaxID=1618371 RepID=A0A0G1RVY3_9BACT|nr:MAG: Outer membrane protein, OmpA/MotB family [Candidatus Beckwithbacteria bacterium GW2011_GWA1_46_30]KKU61271.1 MAG: Outer membrane protein, OmpA/MotB family [Candidatus Beckwithbacteria bacterium GW2011_GWB1_47_15]KKU71435.1 MAG: Outer membrane protein, OmpA/MotB family [Candidatus Beckwithbacteria bacterium GW2011_GWA2_47_25]KKW03077.1 MAG: Outer membrane protein, OmpA/MotB family [Candidatus Beckwithbacteria bacterium GW2011_GWC2_49_11]